MSTPAPAPEREYIARYSSTPVGLLIHSGTGLTDVDGNLMTVTMTRDGDLASPVFSRNADHVALGTYQTTLQGDDTATTGYYMLTWSFRVGGVPKVEQTFFEIGENDAEYLALDQDLRDIVDLTWMRFADGFDSPNGGPVLQTFFQSHYTRNRLAQLLQLAVNRLNSYSQPYQSFALRDPGKFPVTKWGSILEQALYIETLKHLIRSYVEQPMPEGSGNYLRLDRRDYMQRWTEVLQMEDSEFIRRTSVYKMSFMGLGRPHVTVSGGVFGNYGPTRLPGFAAARPTYWARFYA